MCRLTGVVVRTDVFREAGSAPERVGAAPIVAVVWGLPLRAWAGARLVRRRSCGRRPGARRGQRVPALPPCQVTPSGGRASATGAGWGTVRVGRLAPRSEPRLHRFHRRRVGGSSNSQGKATARDVLGTVSSDAVITAVPDGVVVGAPDVDPSCAPLAPGHQVR